MTCYHPIRAYKTPHGVVFKKPADELQQIELPCGVCQGCRLRRAGDWELRIMHEAQLYQANCFITLTYARDKCPENGSLDKKDFQDFLKRLRKHFEPKTIRYYMCGEYGEENKRPHYHACVFNEDFRADRKYEGKSGSGEKYYTSALLEKLWTHGRVSVQDLTPETASYCARYIMTKQLGKTGKEQYTILTQDGELVNVEPEYATMSLKPGIGSRWFKLYHKDIYPHDFAISRGQKRTPPKYYDKLIRELKPDIIDELEYKRTQRAQKAYADNTEERLKTRETVANAKLSRLKRSLA